MKSIKTKKQLRKALSLIDLKDPADIANELYRLNIRGRRRNPNSCPISTYLGKDASVSQCTISVYPKAILGIVNRKFIKIGTPPNISDFILAFDAGKYPWLEKDN